MNGSAFYGKKNIVSHNLRAARENLNMSQKDLAVKLQVMGVDIDQQGISKIEKNNRFVTDYELVCLCKVLKADLEWMIKDCNDLIESNV